MSQAVTASRLHDGAVVSRNPNGRWVERLDRAALCREKAFDKRDAGAGI